MKGIHNIIFLIFISFTTQAQHFGIVRKNYFSNYFDTLINMNVQVLDSSTIRLGSVNAVTGAVSNLGPAEYTMAINLTGATVNPYAGRYIISSGDRMLSFSTNNGDIVSNVPITGPIATFAFQNYRFNPSDTVIYVLVPENFYSTYFDSLTMSFVQVLDSSHIRFASVDPNTGVYTLIGNTNLDNMYALAGNAIDPHQMIFYYSAVDTLMGIDLFNGSVYSQTAIQLPPNALFENFTYSCADTAIYGLTRQNYYTPVYDSILMQVVDQFDSATIRLSKIDPNTGVVTMISPYGIALGATLNGSCFIDPNAMIYYFSTGADLVGVSMATGLIVSNVPKTFQDGAMFFDMMRSAQNCLGAEKVRTGIATTNADINISDENGQFIVPNPASTFFKVQSPVQVDRVQVFELTGKAVLDLKSSSVDISRLPAGMYMVKVKYANGQSKASKLLKQ